MKVAIVGGGPGGLYLGLLLRTKMPDCTVDIFEQNPKSATYGFGVGLQSSSWEFLRADNPDCLADVLKASTFWHGQTIRLNGNSIHIDSADADAGIRRLSLLQMLRCHAEAAGIMVRNDMRVEDARQLDDYDLIVGADGINSVVRGSFDTEFGTTRRTLTSLIAWYGLDKRIEPAQLCFKETAYGWFWCVIYPHSDKSSTFVAECSYSAGQASRIMDRTPEEQVALTAQIFMEELQGANILSNKSAWNPLPVIRVRNWSVGKYALLGDALHSPHPSIGSGTRLSMGDASALAEAIVMNPDNVSAALAEYRRIREPSRMKLVEAMEASMQWYETIGERVGAMTVDELVFDYLGRTGRMNMERLRKLAPKFVERYGHSEFAVSRLAG